MRVVDYFYEYGREVKSDRVELVENRKSYMTIDYMKMFKDRLKNIELDGNTAVLYAAGASLHQGESRQYRGDYTNSLEIQDSGPIIKELTAFMMHKYIGLLNDKNQVTYANINSNTCASSMHSIWEAEQLLNSGRVDNVVIIAEEKTSFNTIRIFNEHDIDVKPGEGFACIVLSLGSGEININDTKWEYSYDRNPFLVSEQGYEKLSAGEYDMVKGHQTGTKQNDESESAIFGSCVKGYKDKIGHTQGASGLIELCMAIDDSDMAGKILCTASGLGGFYGSCIVDKG